MENKEDLGRSRALEAIAGMKRLTEAQQLLQTHLLELGIETVPEYQFMPDRKFRFDLASLEHRIGFECNGHWQGKHGAGWSEGFEKFNLAQMYGWRVLCFHNRDVLCGKAKAFIQQHISEDSKQFRGGIE